MLKERERRTVSLASFHQAKRNGLKDALAVATALAVYQAKGGNDMAFIARLNSLDKEFLGIGATEPGRRKKPVQPLKKKPHQLQRRSAVRAQPRFEAPQEEEEEPQAPEATPPAAEADKNEPPPEPEEADGEADEGVDEDELDEESISQRTAAKTFARMTDGGKDVDAARAKAKTVYQAMSPQPDAAFLKRIEGWSEA
jgi:hypothetical protein